MGDSGNKTFADNPHLEGTRDEFIAKQMSLAYKVGNKYIGYAAANGIEPDDLMSIAMMGLIKAYDGYDPTKEKFEGKVTKFSTYAVPKIKGEIFRVIRDGNHGGIKVGRLSKELALKIIKSEKEYKSVEEVIKDFDVSKQYAVEALDYLSGKTRAGSTSAVVYEGKDGQDITLEDMIGNNEDYSYITLKEFLSSLPEREQEIVKLLFVKDMTQAEVGSIMGISQVQISRILHRIRERAEVFKDFGYTSKHLNSEQSMKEINEKREKPKRVQKKKQLEGKPTMIKRGQKLKELADKMVSAGLEKVLRLLQDTLKSYRDIAEETGVSYATVCYYGKQIRTEAQQRESRTLSAKEANKKVREAKKQEGEKALDAREKEMLEELGIKEEELDTELPNFLKAVAEVEQEEKKKLSTKVDIVAGGDELTIAEIQEEFARTMEMLTATRASSVMKFRMELRVEA